MKVKKDDLKWSLEVVPSQSKNLEFLPNWIEEIYITMIPGSNIIDTIKFSKNSDLGDFVVIINAEKIRLTGNKESQKKYYSHSGYPGGLKTQTFQNLVEQKPEEIILKAVKGMLPKNKLATKMLAKLKVYKGENHPHTGQAPQLLEI